MFSRILCVCVLLVASLCVAEASAQCCLPGRPVARAATAPVRLLRAAQPLRRAAGLVAVVRPVRRAAGLFLGIRR